jgi:hypothetical protein
VKACRISKRTARCDRVESGGQHGDTGLIGARDACAIIAAGIALLQPFPLRIADIATFPIATNDVTTPNNVAMRASACPSG